MLSKRKCRHTQTRKDTNKGYAMRLSLLLVLLMIQLIGFGQNPMLPQQAVHAVVIGISDYQNISDLKYADRDAEAFVQFLQSPAGGNVPAENIRLLINEQATSMEIVRELYWLMDESHAGDRAYIYFSGHGDVEKKTSRARGYLLAHNVPTTTYMAGGALSLLDLQDIVSTMAVDKEVEVVLIADACRAGTLAGNSINGNHATAEILAKSIQNEVRILSCQPDQLSQESERWGGGRGVFSYHLIQGLTGLADEIDDEVVDIMELQVYLPSQVRRATAAKQIPMVQGPPTFKLAAIDRESLAKLEKQIADEQLFEGISQETREDLVMRDRSPQVSTPDSTIWKLYLKFQEALQNKNYLYPTEDAAYSIYQKIKDAPGMEPHRDQMKWDLAVGLNDEVQQAINSYLRTSLEELQERWSNNERYEHYPEYLGKAAELLGSSNLMYEDLITRRLYFEGLQLRLRGEQAKQEEKISLYQQALARQEEVVKRDPSAAYAYNELGLLYRRMKEKEKANRYFYLALEESPAWLLPMANLITNYTDLEQPDSALAVGRRALAIDSTFALIFHNLGYTYEKKVQWAEAIQNYEKAIRLNPAYATSYYNIGVDHYQLKQYSQAEKYFLQYIGLSPEDPDGWSAVAFVSRLQEKREQEVFYLQKAHTLAPQDEEILQDLIYALYSLSRTEEAERIYLSFVDNGDTAVNASTAHYQLAVLLAAESNYLQAAMDQLEKAVDKGFNELEKLKSEEDLAPLQTLTRYKELLKKLE
jgi:tetratricopeptide (TPR) repeat protein